MYCCSYNQLVAWGLQAGCRPQKSTSVCKGSGILWTHLEGRKENAFPWEVGHHTKMGTTNDHHSPQRIFGLGQLLLPVCELLCRLGWTPNGTLESEKRCGEKGVNITTTMDTLLGTMLRKFEASLVKGIGIIPSGTCHAIQTENRCQQLCHWGSAGAREKRAMGTGLLL